MTKENLKDLLVLLKLYPYEEYIDDIKIDSSVKNSKYEFYEEVNIHVFLKIPNECPVCHSHDVKRVRTKVKENIIHSFSTIVEKEKFGTKGLINLTYYAMVCKQCGETFTNSDVLTTITNKVTDYTVIGVLRSLSDLGKTYKNVADTFGISATLVQKLFDQHVEVDYVPLPKVISIDEFYKKSSSQKYACTILDYLNYKVITVLQSRRKEYLVNFLQSRPKEELENVEFFIIDMYYVYKDVFGALLPNAYCCVDSLC